MVNAVWVRVPSLAPKPDTILVVSGFSLQKGGVVMNHQEFKSISPYADSAVLFIHGILGTPDHFDKLITLVPPSLSIHNLLLDGHGKNAKDFGKTSMQKWETQVQIAVCDLLRTHKNLYIVAHSMGTLFAIEQAIKCTRIKGLFLLAVPIKVEPKKQMLHNAVAVYRGNISSDDHFAVAARAACSIEQSRNPLHYLPWISRYLELFQKIRRTRIILPYLRTPTIAIESKLDEMVAKNANQYLTLHSNMDVYILEKSYHYVYNERDWEEIIALFKKFLDS